MPDVDPEAGYDLSAPAEPAGDDEAAEERREQERQARQHYTSVGESAMRRKANLSESSVMAEPRYRGVRASRAEMFGGDEEGDEEDEGDEDEEEGDEGEEEGDEDEEGDKDDEELDEEEQSDEQDDGVGDEADETDDVQGSDLDDQDAADSNRDEDAEGADGAPVSKSQDTQAPAKAARAKTRASEPPTAFSEQESRELLDRLHAERSQDAQKGEQVRKQIRAWEHALRLRIALQKVAGGASRLPPPGRLAQFCDAAPGTADSSADLAAELEQAAGTLQDVRVALWRTSFPELTEPLSKLPEEPPERALRALEQLLEPHRRTLLTRWSNKTAAAPGMPSAASRLQLRAMNQGAVEQIDQALAGDGMDRLVERTRVWRGGDGAERLGLESETLDGDSRANQADAEVFDDSDFYSQLLRDLIESAELVDADASARASDALKHRKRKRAVDVRASKGRRIRYEVMDKVQNFMPPVPRTRWADDQISRFFTSLAGSDGAPEEAVANGEPEPETPVADGFRVFG